MKVGTRFQKIAAAVAATVVTVAIIGVVLVSTTSIGCGPANAMHIKLSSSRCTKLASTIASPAPSATGSQAPSPYPTYPPPSPYVPSPSSNPFPEPASNPFPQPASGNPFPDPASGFPTFGGPASSPLPPGLAMNCRLPIYAGGPGSGGFIVFPGGNFIADPRSAVTAPSPSPGGPSPTPQYGGYPGWWGTTYDKAYSRWLPVPYAWVSPDGKRYAYPGAPDGIYVQNISNGTQVEVGEGKSWQVIDVEASGVYAVTGSTGGLWLLPFSGTEVQIISGGYWQAVGGGFAYGTATSAVPQGVGTSILRLDLRTGSTTEFFGLQGLQSAVQGFDANGNPVIYVWGQSGLQIWIGTAPNVATQIANLNGANFYPNGRPVADGHGLWFAAGNGIALHVQGAGWYFMSGFGGQLAGGCD